MLAVDSVVQGTAELLVDGRGPADRSFSRAVIDSPRGGKGDLLFALHSERPDGHHLIAQAPGGPPARAPGPPGRRAPPPLQRRPPSGRPRHDIRVIGVTGSVGKTTCKELIAAVLGARYRVLKSPDNLNTEIGLPLTLLYLTEEHERAALARTRDSASA